MAHSLPSVVLPSGTWVDIYLATGIATGTKLIIQNLDDSDVRLVESSVMPLLTDGFNIITEKSFLESADTPIGVWAYAYRSGVSVQVEEAQS